MSFTPVSIKDANSAEVDMGAFQDAAGNNFPAHSGDTNIAHYRCAKAQLAPVATPTAYLVIQGSATKTVRIKKIKVHGLATAAGTMDVIINKCSAAGTLGSAVLTALTKVPLDSGNSAATAVVSTVGTANYTTEPTVVGVIGAQRLMLSADGSGVNAQPAVWEFGKDGCQAVVLRGTAQHVTISGNGDALPSGAKVDLEVEWSEDNS